METVREQYSLECPSCHKYDWIAIEIKVWAELHPDGTDVDSQDHEWDDSSLARCSNCQFEGTVAHFQYEQKED